MINYNHTIIANTQKIFMNSEQTSQHHHMTSDIML